MKEEENDRIIINLRSRKHYLQSRTTRTTSKYKTKTDNCCLTLSALLFYSSQYQPFSLSLSQFKWNRLKYYLFSITCIIGGRGGDRTLFNLSQSRKITTDDWLRFIPFYICLRFSLNSHFCISLPLSSVFSLRLFIYSTLGYSFFYY